MCFGIYNFEINKKMLKINNLWFKYFFRDFWAVIASLLADPDYVLLFIDIYRMWHGNIFTIYYYGKFRAIFCKVNLKKNLYLPI